MTWQLVSTPRTTGHPHYPEEEEEEEEEGEEEEEELRYGMGFSVWLDHLVYDNNNDTEFISYVRDQPQNILNITAMYSNK